MQQGAGKRMGGKVEPSGWLSCWWSHNLKSLFQIHRFPVWPMKVPGKLFLPFFTQRYVYPDKVVSAASWGRALGRSIWVLTRTATGNRRDSEIRMQREQFCLNRGNQCNLWCFRTSCSVSLHCSRNVWVPCGCCAIPASPSGWLKSLASLGTLDACIYTVPISLVIAQIRAAECDPLISRKKCDRAEFWKLTKIKQQMEIWLFLEVIPSYSGKPKSVQLSHWKDFVFHCAELFHFIIICSIFPECS